ncbi:trypsin-like peptidase domain-containing protein [Pseudarthrobacter sulfonivorans]|uniref:S1C family serine protease n=1 Tax=Pseudarthrobacter sulfonivorans TaxID=121292 RepID=UPI00168AD25C|nr:trypsin-like peptidase domain-containing protein [Pseudarthrobacter sulfonivorans]
MTENPTPGAAPDDRQPDWSRNPAQTPSEARSDAGGHSNPTEQLDRSGAPENPTQQLPGAPRPVYPPREPFYGQPAHNQQTQHQQPHNQQVPHQQAQHGANSALPGGYTGQYNPGQYNSTPNPADAPRRKASFGVGTLVASILAAGLVGGGVATVGSGALGNGSPSAVSSSTGSQPGTVIVNNKDDVNAITAAALKATPSVVTISASSGNAGGTGSGIVLDGDGHILTNTHVVTLDGQTANATLEVRTSTGKVLKATLVGTDPLSDLAVIKVDDTSGLTPATLGDSGKLNVGDTAIAIGSPLGLTGTVTDGIVSTLNRTISVASSAAPKNGDSSQGGDQGFQFAPPGGGQGQSTAAQGSIAINVIQTDAAINPGNSGGALVNTKGEIIGVNVAIASAGSDSSSSSSSGNIGVGFSIPINHAKRVAQELIDTGKASHGQLGVSVRDKSSGSSSSFSVGADVATVEANSAAAKAGIKVGDVITKFNDLTVSEPNQLTAAVREQAGGSTVKITVLRNGQEQTFDVTLGTAADQ